MRMGGDDMNAGRQMEGQCGLFLQILAVGLMFLAALVGAEVFRLWGSQWCEPTGHAKHLAILWVACYAASLFCFWIGNRVRHLARTEWAVDWHNIFKTRR